MHLSARIKNDHFIMVIDHLLQANLSFTINNEHQNQI